MTPARLQLARFDRAVLEVVRRLQPKAYGCAIQNELPLEKFLFFWRARPSLGKVYAALDRLQERGYVRPRASQAVFPERGYRPRLYWFLEDGA